MVRQLEDFWKYAPRVTKKEDKDPGPPEFKKISKEKIRQTVENINAKLKSSESITDSDKKAKAKLNYTKNNFEKNLAKYEVQETIVAERNSYSKTDKDATFMRRMITYRTDSSNQPTMCRFQQKIRLSSITAFISKPMTSIR